MQPLRGKRHQHGRSAHPSLIDIQPVLSASKQWPREETKDRGNGQTDTMRREISYPKMGRKKGTAGSSIEKTFTPLKSTEIVSSLCQVSCFPFRPF
jgi:hypothetical protein